MCRDMNAFAPALQSWYRPLARIDRVWLAMAAAAILGTVLAPELTSVTGRFVLSHLIAIAPFLALAIGIAAYAKASGSDNLTVRAFSGRPSVMVISAALMGALSPFCSCGGIPLIAAALSMGVPLPAVMAFWLSSPLMDPSMFVVTAACWI